MEASNQAKDEMISSFCGITGVEAERGQFYLESANWNLQLAIQSFFEHSTEDSANVNVNVNNNQNPAVAQRAQEFQEMFGNTPLVNPPSSDEDSSQEMPSAAKPTKQKTKEVQKQSSSRIATIDSLRRTADSGASSGEEEGQAFYTGGSEHSGQQVLGPSRKKNPDELVSNLFASAKEHGAEVVDPSEAKTKKPTERFVGTGFRLGSTVEPSAPVQSASAPRRQTREIHLILWRNGFTVDDGPLRSFEDPANRDFLGSIGRGEIPIELVHKYRTEEIHMNMEDKRNEEYSAPKRRLQAFTGEGHRLGNPAAEVVSSADHSNADPKVSEEDARKRLATDESQPTTNIQIRLTDGTRLVAKLNHSHTIAQIRQFICDSRPAFAAQTFQLMTTFPNKELSDETLTIKDANLMNATIVMKIIN